MEKRIQKIYEKLYEVYEVYEDLNVQIYYDNNGWGYVNDGVFQGCGSLDSLEQCIDKMLEE